MQRLEHFNTLTVGHLNINSIRNKFETIAETITNFDISLISELKIWWGLMLYSNEEIPCKFLNNHAIVPNAAIICIEFHQLKRKWILLGCNKPLTLNDLEFIASITKIVDFYLFIIGNLNMTTENIHLNVLLKMCDLTALIKEPTCYQSQNPNCIDHFLTNWKALFKHFRTFETGLSDHHKLNSTIMK